MIDGQIAWPKLVKEQRAHLENPLFSSFGLESTIGALIHISPRPFATCTPNAGFFETKSTSSLSISSNVNGIFPGFKAEVKGGQRLTGMKSSRQSETSDFPTREVTMSLDFMKVYLTRTPPLQAVCTTSAGAMSELTLAGVGKYPFLAVSQSTVDFGEVLSGSTVDEEVILTNAALVAAPFQITSVNGAGDDRCIRVTPARGRLRPNERIALKVRERMFSFRL